MHGWYSDRESNPDLLFRRELFYPLNYQSEDLFSISIITSSIGFSLFFTT